MPNLDPFRRALAQRAVAGQQNAHLPTKWRQSGRQSAHHIGQTAGFDERHAFGCDREDPAFDLHCNISFAINMARRRDGPPLEYS